MSFADWIKSGRSGLASGINAVGNAFEHPLDTLGDLASHLPRGTQLSPASMYQLGKGIATTMRDPVKPAMVEPAKNPYAEADPRRQAINEIQMQNYAEEAAMQQAQQKLLLAENLRDSVKQAREVNQFRSQQALAYSGSGVRLQGTPLLVLEETRKLGQQEIDAATQASIARADLMRRRSLIMQNEGRAQMLGADIAWSTARNEFDMREQSSYALSQIRRNTGDSRIGNILSSLGGLLPGYTGFASRKPSKKTPALPSAKQTQIAPNYVTPRNAWTLPEDERDQ